MPDAAHGKKPEIPKTARLPETAAPLQSSLDTLRFAFYQDAMKVIFASILLAGASLVLAGCETDMPPDPSAPNKFERGISGKGSLTEPDRSEDPIIKENTRIGE
jgi:hypothetical protein